MAHTGVCVNKCPDTKGFDFPAADQGCHHTDEVKSCLITKNQGYATKEVLNICIPSDLDSVGA